MKTFGERLKELRIASGLGQKEVAAWIGVSDSSIRKYESGERTPDPNAIKTLASQFNVTTDYLLGNDTPASSQIPSNNQKLLDLLKDLAGNNDWQFILNSHDELTDEDVSRLAADVKRTVFFNKEQSEK